jgi:hypothetical protein
MICYPAQMHLTSKSKADDWEIILTLLKYGASIGSGSINCSITIGEFALIGAGVTTRDIQVKGIQK